MTILLKTQILRIFYANHLNKSESFLLHQMLSQNIKKVSKLFSNAEKMRKIDDLINQIESISNELNLQEQRTNNPIPCYS
ncbi:MAG: hypothetical protein K1060chlam3_00309 [Candidatus Anoxychlamydiales bacterium]|nr:hypothetical protein [Candidatus Anoxychlamydiales bacterium]